MGTYDFKFENNAISTLALAVTTTSQTTITVAAGEGALFPSLTGDGSDFFYCTMVKQDGTKEIICIVARSTDVLTVGVPGSGSANASGRAYDGSTASTFSVDDVIELRVTAGIMEAFRDGVKIGASLSFTSTAKTSDYDVTAGNCNGFSTFINDGAGGQVIFTLPALAAGYRVRFIVTDAQYLQVKANTGEKIRYLGTQTAAAGYVRSNVVGNILELEATADDWVIVNIGGIWLYDE